VRSRGRTFKAREGFSVFGLEKEEKREPF